MFSLALHALCCLHVAVSLACADHNAGVSTRSVQKKVAHGVSRGSEEEREQARAGGRKNRDTGS
jgi:hypothetical protein